MKWENEELIRTLDRKFKGREPFFDYSPADVFFWERLAQIMQKALENEGKKTQ